MEKPLCKLCGKRHRLGPCELPDWLRNPPTVTPKTRALIEDNLLGAAASLLVTGGRENTVISQLAAPGQCPHCDLRRAKIAEAVRLHRARKTKG